MKRPGFGEGVMVALAGAVLAGAAWQLLVTMLPAATAARILVALLTGAYLSYLLLRGGLRVGRITAVVGWCVLTTLLAVLDPPLTAHVAVHAGAVWLLRVLVFQRGVLSALADAGLVALGVAAAGWAMFETHSAAMAAWCLLLVQAVFPQLPRDLRRDNSVVRDDDADNRFERAHHAAENALARLASHR